MSLRLGSRYVVLFVGGECFNRRGPIYSSERSGLSSLHIMSVHSIFLECRFCGEIHIVVPTREERGEGPAKGA